MLQKSMKYAILMAHGVDPPSGVRIVGETSRTEWNQCHAPCPENLNRTAVADARPLSRPAVEVADIFRHRGPAWRASHAGHVSLGQLKVMSAIERCRTAALGGHVERCEDCAHLRISYNSCRNRHCPKCQAATAKEWLADRQAELL